MPNPARALRRNSEGQIAGRGPITLTDDLKSAASEDHPADQKFGNCPLLEMFGRGVLALQISEGLASSRSYS